MFVCRKKIKLIEKTFSVRNKSMMDWWELPMSFRYLPMDLLIVIGVGILMIHWVSTIRKEHPMSFCTGVVLLSIGAILAGIREFIARIGILNSYLDLIRILAMAIGFLGLILLYIGVYIKVKDDPYRKKKVLLAIYTLVIILTLCGLVFAYADLFYK
jgi:hypothetical protein